MRTDIHLLRKNGDIVNFSVKIGRGLINGAASALAVTMVSNIITFRHRTKIVLLVFVKQQGRGNRCPPCILLNRFQQIKKTELMY